MTSTAGGELAGAADLLALARNTDATLTAPAPGSPEAQDQAAAAAQKAAEAPKLTLEQELAGMFAMIGAGAGHWLPSVGQVLNDQACAELGKVLAPVAHKYGLARHFEGFAWRLELQALMVVAPIGMAIAAAVRHDLAELERRQAEAEGRPAAVAIAASSSSTASESSIEKPLAPPPAAAPGMLQPIKRPEIVLEPVA